MTETTSNEPTKWKRGVAMFILVPLGMMLGGLVIAWISEGPILYSYTDQTITGKVSANAPGALTDEADDKRHFILFSYDECDDVRQALPVPDLSTVKKAQRAIAEKERDCLEPMKVGQPVNLTVEIRENRLNNKREWRVTRVNECDTSRVPSVIVPGGQSRCSWM